LTLPDWRDAVEIGIPQLAFAGGGIPAGHVHDRHEDLLVGRAGSLWNVRPRTRGFEGCVNWASAGLAAKIELHQARRSKAPAAAQPGTESADASDSAPLHVARFFGYAHFEAFQRLGQDDLAREPAGAGDSRGEIEHVFLVLAGAAVAWRTTLRLTTTWQVEQAICPSHVPSSGSPAFWPSSSSRVPGSAAAVMR